MGTDGYLPVDGVKETDEVIESGSESGAELRGEFLNQIRHLIHVGLHSRSKLLHSLEV